jgi:hypothetical protein
VRTLEQRALRVGFGDREVVVCSGDPAVMGVLERMFSLMPAAASERTVAQLEVCRENGHYAVRDIAGAILTMGSLTHVARHIRHATVRLLMDARPDLLWFHAGAVALRGRTVLLPGPPGGGKSTLVTSLCSRGWSYLSDEIAPFDPHSHSVLPFALAPAVREYPGREMPPEWVRMATKEQVRLRPDGVCREPTPVAAVVRPCYRRHARPELVVASRATSALHLLEQCGNFASDGEAAVRYVCALVQRIPCFSVCFSDAQAGAEVVARELERRW